MPSKSNPLKLNPLQLKTLTLVQELARSPGDAEPGEAGIVKIRRLPHAHGDHLHVGQAMVHASDATGLGNPAVWTALERKGLVAPLDPPYFVAVTPAGLAYDTGEARKILGGADH